MLDDIIDGLLDALYRGTLNECRHKYNSAIEELNNIYAKNRVKKVSEITRAIKTIDRIIDKVGYKVKVMNMSEEAKIKIVQATIDSFKQKRQELQIEKRRVASSNRCLAQ